jgi:hypothetical protein
MSQVVEAGHAAGVFSRRLHRGQEQGDEAADDRHDDQQLHERKASVRGRSALRAAGLVSAHE